MKQGSGSCFPVSQQKKWNKEKSPIPLLNVNDLFPVGYFTLLIPYNIYPH